jgi:oligopeptide/dipeptide ABC transporter ATP-binding protein
MPEASVILSARGLHTRFRVDAGEIFPSRGIDLDLRRGEVLGLVGESGSGKSVTARALARLVQPDSAVVSGTVNFNGNDLYSLPPEALRALRGREIAIIVQDPAAALNPVMTVGEQITRIARTGPDGLGAEAARAAAIALLERLRIAEPERRLSAYPHQMSGGMKQRILIAMALIRRPSVLIADEPTTALDLTVAAEILGLLDELRRDLGMSMLLISHDLAMIARHCDRVAVMYAGRIVEEGATGDVLGDPKHPYTRALLGSVPKGTRADGLLPAIPGEPPDLARLPQGCAFQARCPERAPACALPQTLRPAGNERSSACWRVEPNEVRV